LSSANANGIPLLKEAVQWINLTAALNDDEAPPDAAYWNALVAGVFACRFTRASGWEIYRARVMPLERELDTEPLAAEDMGPPPPSLSRAGRINRDGVPCFYGALERETAMAEVRPWRRARISVAKFKSTSALALVDLTGRFVESKPTSQVRWLSFMLGRPVHPDDRESYLASQRVADECRAADLSGILYDSSLKPGGVNVALFAHDGLACQKIELHEVTGASYRTQRLSP